MISSCGARRRAAVRRIATLRLPRRAVAPSLRIDPAADADVAGERLRALLEHRRLARLPAEAAEHQRLVLDRPDAIGAPGDAVAIAIVGVLVRADRLGRDRLDQSEADHLRRHARRDHRARMQRAVAEIGDAIARPPQRHDLAAGKLDRHLLVRDDHPPLAGMALDAELLQLPAVGRLGNDIRAGPPPAPGAAASVSGGIDRRRNIDTERSSMPIAARGMSAPVLQVAALAGARVVERPEPVRRFRRRRRRHPELAKDAHCRA